MPRKPRYKWGLDLIRQEEQVYGSFDQGKIVERKPIGFSGEGSPINRLGPLYYWAWAHCDKTPAAIPLHPHRGFEILSYVFAGEIRHSDSLGRDERLEADQWQLMQTGSGVEHEEDLMEGPVSLFQIWFDPGFRQEVIRGPNYMRGSVDFVDIGQGVYRYSLTDSLQASGLAMRTVGLEITDLKIKPHGVWQGHISSQRSMALMVVTGEVALSRLGPEMESVNARSGDFCYLNASSEEQLQLLAKEELRVLLIELDLFPSYGLFPKPK